MKSSVLNKAEEQGLDPGSSTSQTTQTESSENRSFDAVLFLQTHWKDVGFVPVWNEKKMFKSCPETESSSFGQLQWPQWPPALFSKYSSFSC